jgi:hypothetical protein
MKFTDLYTKQAKFFDKLDTSQFTVRVVCTPEDREKALQVRARGYNVYGELDPEEAVAKPNETTFLAVDQDDYPVGTVRVLDRSKGKIELDNFIDVDSLLTDKEKPCAEATRFAIPKHPKSLVIKLMLWRSCLDYCLLNNIKTGLISSRSIIAKNYSFLLFKDLGKEGTYRHKHLKNIEHRTYKMDVGKMPLLWRRANHPLYKFMFTREA